MARVIMVMMATRDDVMAGDNDDDVGSGLIMIVVSGTFLCSLAVFYGGGLVFLLVGPLTVFLTLQRSPSLFFH